MRCLLSFLASFALLGAALAATQDVQVDIDWRVTIDPQGHVTSMTAAPNERVDRVPQIRAKLEQEVRGWNFLPGTVDGKPAETQTGLHVAATLTVADNNTVHIQIDHAGVGGTLLKAIPPRYPASAIKRQKQGEVVLHIAYDTTGRVTSASVDPDAPGADASLIDASVKIAREWKFSPETVDGHEVAGEAIAPFCYRLGRDRKYECDWKPKGRTDALRDGETLALNPVAKLLTDVAGRTL